ncbi:hypothetical protein [Olleya sp.]|jgi:hypothetical protein|uniref:hypothetical protein n=1 Tax=Olleya sp. TaxID=1906788 RepID=UPI0032D8BB4D
MEKSKQSEEDILKLGKKLISELKLDDTVNTLARWMTHYLAELMCSIETTESETDKIELKKECCNLIIELWQIRDRLPIQKPLDNAHEFLEILRVLKKEEKSASMMPRWVEYRTVPRDSPWSSFVEKVKHNSEKIFYRAIEVNLNNELLIKDNEWLNEHKEFLSDEEKEIIQHLNTISKIDFSSGVIDLDDESNKKEVNPEERLKVVFEEMEKLIEEEKKVLKDLKKMFFKSLRDKNK